METRPLMETKSLSDKLDKKRWCHQGPAEGVDPQIVQPGSGSDSNSTPVPCRPPEPLVVRPGQSPNSCGALSTGTTGTLEGSWR